MRLTISRARILFLFIKIELMLLVKLIVEDIVVTSKLHSSLILHFFYFTRHKDNIYESFREIFYVFSGYFNELLVEPAIKKVCVIVLRCR